MGLWPYFSNREKRLRLEFPYIVICNTHLSSFGTFRHRTDDPTRKFQSPSFSPSCRVCRRFLLPALLLCPALFRPQWQLNDIEKSSAKTWSFNLVWKDVRSDKLQQWFLCFLFTSWENLTCNGPSPVKIFCSRPRAWCARCGASAEGRSRGKIFTGSHC